MGIQRGSGRAVARHTASSVVAIGLWLAVASCSDTTAPEPSVATTIEPSVDTVTFTALGQVAVLSATVRDQYGRVMPAAATTWASSADSVATVTDDGVVTAAGNGETALTVSSRGALAGVIVSVHQVATSLALLPDSVVLGDPGDTARVSLAARDARGVTIQAPSVVWASADSTVATVDDSGLVTAVETGTVVISATVDDAIGTTTARVEPQVTLVSAGPTVLSGEVATELSLAVRVEDLLGAGYGGTDVSWSTAAGSGSIVSGETSVSDATGHAGAVWRLGTTAGAQQATASIESRGRVVEVAFSASATAGPAVTAALAADSIILNGPRERAFLGPTYVDAYGNPTTGTGMVWESRDPAVATVRADGLVTAVDAGATYLVGSLDAPVDSLLVTVRLSGAITVTFDDGFVDAYTNAFPVFQEFGLRGNIAVNPAQVGYPAYMSKADLDVVDAAGFSVVSHTMTHDSLTTASDGKLVWELSASRQWIEDQGYRGANVFIVPYHVWGARERDVVGQYYEAARGTSANSVVPDSLVSWMPWNPYDLTGIEADDLPYTSVAGRDALRALLQRAMDEGAFIDVFFHHLAAADVDAFRQTLAVIDEFRDRVLPYHELYPELARSVY